MNFVLLFSLNEYLFTLCRQVGSGFIPAEGCRWHYLSADNDISREISVQIDVPDWGDMDVGLICSLLHLTFS